MASEHASPDLPATILALSAADRAELKEKIKTRFLSPGVADFARIREQCRSARAVFSNADNCRLLIVIDPATDIEKTLTDCLSYLDSRPEVNRQINREVNWREKNICFGQSPHGKKERKKIGLVFPGQGSQYVRMGAALLDRYPELREIVRQAGNCATNEAHFENVLYPALTEDKEEQKQQLEKLQQTEMAQPAIGAASTVLLDLLARFSVFPDAVCGHSYGELTALHAAGRLERSDFFSLSAARGKFMAEAGKAGDAGRMMAIKAPIADIPELIREHGLDLILANRNTPDQGVLSGPSQDIEKMQAICKEKHIRGLVLPVSAAFHSRLVESAARPFRECLEGVSLASSPVPVYSNTTGRPYPSDEASARKLLGRHLLNPVHFIDDIEAMFADGVDTFVEVGPKPVLTGLIRAILKGRDFTAVATDSSSGKQPALTDLALALCQLAAAGHPVDLTQWSD